MVQPLWRAQDKEEQDSWEEQIGKAEGGWTPFWQLLFSKGRVYMKRSHVDFRKSKVNRLEKSYENDTED